MKTIFTLSERLIYKQFLPLVLMLLLGIATSGQMLHVVEVRDTEFDPAELEITAGDTVEWRNVLGFHNVNGTQSTYPSNPESFGNTAGNDWTYQHVFTVAGSYDYHCDPHVELGMKGKVTVLESGPFMLTVNFSGMNPHVGQDFYLAVVDKNSGIEAGRIHTTAEVNFLAEVSGIETGKSYYVDFWADHNGNGMYDAPPADHAWRLDLNDVTGNTTLDFVHNTTFTDIMWKNLLTVEFSAMNPHVGQNFYLAVIDSASGMEIGRTHAVAETAFSVEVPGIEPGKSYHIDFWADHNRNGMYDTPPTDHAWRLELNDVTGDTTLMFVHNTTFTDIMWKNLLTVEFSNMNPHVGQDFYLAVIERSSGIIAARAHKVAQVDFTVMVPGIEPGKSYDVDFWADHNRNGMYDAPPADHAWRLELNDVTGDTTLMFVHNTTFTDIMWKYTLALELSGMNPHVGQDFYLSVAESSSGMVIGRTHATAEVNFTVEVTGIEAGKSYHVDFWADHNRNGMYDAPPADHAWRLELNEVMGDTTLMFAHNTTFTDIMWKNRVTVEFSDMNPHIGQMLVLYVVNTEDEMVQDTVTVNEIMEADFSVHSYSIMPGNTYHVNFYADFNQNGMYDAPPVDHAWQIMLENVTGDTTLTFVHNTNFTDIFPVTSSPLTESQGFSIYPNPAKSKVWIESDKFNTRDYTLSVFDISGRLAKVESMTRNNRIEVNVQYLNKGIYFLQLKSASEKVTMKLIKN
jgi:plastocyanin